MNLFLQIVFVDDQFQFNKPIKIEEITCADIDNFSSPEVIQTAIRAIHQSERLFIYAELKEGVQQGSILKIIQELRAFKRTMKLTYSGNSTHIEPLLKKLKGEKLEKEKLEVTANQFFN